LPQLFEHQLDKTNIPPCLATIYKDDPRKKTRSFIEITLQDSALKDPEHRASATFFTNFFFNYSQ
jgi:hypothetical protein